MQRRRKTPAGAYDPLAWMFTLSDLMLLLLTAFVLRFSMTTFDSPLFHRAFPYPKGTAAEEMTSERIVALHPLEMLFAGLQSAFADISDGLQSSDGGQTVKFRDGIELVRADEEVVLRLGCTAFSAGTAELSFQGQEAVAAAARAIKTSNVAVLASAYLEKGEPAQGSFPTNWELAHARAIALRRQMIDIGVSAKTISAAAYTIAARTAREQGAGAGAGEGVEIHFLPVP